MRAGVSFLTMLSVLKRRVEREEFGNFALDEAVTVHSADEGKSHLQPKMRVRKIFELIRRAILTAHRHPWQ